MRHLVTGSIVLVLVMALRPSAQDRPLPAREEFFSATEQNLLKSQREQAHFAYHERRSQLHTNPFGKIGTDGSRVYEFTPGPEPGVFYRRLVEQEGKPVTGSKPEQLDLRRREPSSKKNPIEDALQVLDFTIERRDVVDGRDMIVIAFRPRPDAKSDSRAAAMAEQFKGEVWVDESAHEVARVSAVAVDDLSFGFGLLARLNEGTRVTLTRQKVDGTAWLPTSLRFMGEGRAMLFRKLVLDYVVEWFDYRRVE